MSTDPATTQPMSTPLARRACEGLTLGQAVVIAQHSNVPWVAAAAQEGTDGFTLGEPHSFPAPGVDVWWARLLHFVDPDGRRCALSLIPALDGRSWRMVRRRTHEQFPQPATPPSAPEPAPVSPLDELLLD